MFYFVVIEKTKYSETKVVLEIYNLVNEKSEQILIAFNNIMHIKLHRMGMHICL